MKVGEWLANGSISDGSRTMAAIALGARSGVFDVPCDLSDFERCYVLVSTVPEIRDDFPIIARCVPQFAAILRDWDRLCAIYEKGSSHWLALGYHIHLLSKAPETMP